MQRHTITAIALTLGASAQAMEAQTPPVRITFEATADQYRGSAQEYETIWRQDGPRIVAVMERRASLTFISPLFADTAIHALIVERPSSSGYRARSPMELRASYPESIKRGTLVHELGHRLMAGLHRRTEDDHADLFLWLYDVWVELYGVEFADEQVTAERLRLGPYPAAWDAALALTATERAARWQEILRERLPRRR